MFDDIRWILEPLPAQSNEPDDKADRLKKAEDFSKLIADERYMQADLIKERIKNNIKCMLFVESEEMTKKMRWETLLLMDILFAPEKFIKDGEKIQEETLEASKQG